MPQQNPSQPLEQTQQANIPNQAQAPASQQEQASPALPSKPKRRSLEERRAAAEQKLRQAQALKERLDKELSQKNRAERNGQLVAWGIAVETVYKTDKDERPHLRKRILGVLTDKTRQRAEEGFARLDRDIPGNGLHGAPETPFDV